MKEYNVKVTRQAYEHLSNIKRYIQYELSAPEAAANMSGEDAKEGSKKLGIYAIENKAYR